MNDPKPHAAAGQALGYVHQVQWSLVELMQRARQSPTAILRLESLDDIEISDADGEDLGLTQLKHQVKPATDLTENSVDLWRTLNVWMDVLSRSDAAARNPVLKLVTTARIPDSSLLNHLRPNGSARDVDRVVTGLESAATNSRNETSAPWRRKFLQLRAAERLSMVSLITIDDGSPRARDVGEALKESLRFVAPPGKVDAFIPYLLGLWYQICIRLLDRTLDSVSVADLESEISALRDQFLPDNLPLAPEILVPFTEEDAVPYRDRRFVHQLLWIALDEERLWRAIRDYHRAWTQRSEWVRLNLISESELERYAFRLHDEWESVFYQRVSKMRREGETNEETAGQDILERVSSESRARVRERFQEPWLNRGTLHAMAEGWSNRTIGWHPDFVSMLAQLLEGVA